MKALEHGKAPAKRRLGLQSQIFSCLLIFSALMLIMLWLMQVVYLDRFYERIKTSQIESAAASLSLYLDSSQVGEMAENIAQSKDICISVYAVHSISGLAVHLSEVCRADVTTNCVIHHMAEKSLFRYYEAAETAAAQGDSYSQRISMDGFGADAAADDDDADDTVTPLWDRFADNQPSPLPDSLVYARLFTTADGNQYLLLLNSTISPVTSTVATLRVQLALVSAILILLALVLSSFIAHWLGRPLAGLNKAASRLALGDFSGNFSGGGCREIDELAGTLSLASSELAKSDSLQHEITANISHDLRTPLTMIGGYAEFMRDFPQEDHADSIDVIISETQRLSQLVRDVLDSSRLASGTETLNISTFCLSDLLGDIAARYNALIEKDGFRLQLDCQDDIWVEGDETRLDQAISNLLNNAVAHCGEDKLIRLTQTAQEAVARVEIADNGPGIARDDLPLIWQRYYHTDAPARGVKGSGLGLSIVRGIFELHRLRYGVRSQLGAGATFWFEIGIK